MTAQPAINSIVRAAPAPLHVIIIGGGIGGLTLAQGLKKSGVNVAVYERDRTMTDRVQGYRVHINPAGSLALHECLPPELFETLARTCGKPSRGIRFVTERMKVLISFDMINLPQGVNGDHIALDRSVSRITLREVLLAGLDDVVRFGKTFERYEELPTGRVLAHFGDGTSAEGDVLVAADGGGSRVRRQFLPHAERVDTGIIGIAGKVFLDGGNRDRIAPELRNGMTLASGQGGHCLFVALQEINGAAMSGLGGNDESAAAGAHFDNARGYLMWAFGARREKLGLAGRDTDQMSGDELRKIVIKAMTTRAWDQRFRDLVHLADPATINAITIRTSMPVFDDAISRYRRQCGA
jgi:2-polyprenyl-6-methoxyphenol hydroxylase-like FAD-dependent oxidoreductase